MQVEEAANTILESPYGLHALVVYSDITILREFWSFYTKKSIEDQNELVCLTSFYDTVDSMRKTLSEGHIPIDVTEFEKDEKSLIFRDSLEAYMDDDGKAHSTESLVKGIQHLEIQANQLDKNGASILADMGAFLFKNQIKSLVEYEMDLPLKFEKNFKGVCMYHQKDFDRILEDSKKKIIEHHQISIKI